MACQRGCFKIIWTKLKCRRYDVISEGTLDVRMPEGADLFTTSGILVYRASTTSCFISIMPGLAKHLEQNV